MFYTVCCRGDGIYRSILSWAQQIIGGSYLCLFFTFVCTSTAIASSTSASNLLYFYTHTVLILKTIVVLELFKENLYLEPAYIGDSAFYFTNTYSRITASGLSLEVEFQEPYNFRLGKKIFFHNVQQNHTCAYII